MSAHHCTARANGLALPPVIVVTGDQGQERPPDHFGWTLAADHDHHDQDALREARL
jgi:hypothetical protein